MADDQGADEDRRRGDDERPDGAGDNGKASNPRRRSVVIAVAAVVILVALGVGVAWLHARHFESTDDAFVDTDIQHVAPRVAGQVVGVFVVDNQHVAAGQPLAQLDDSAARTQLAKAEAARAQALAQAAQAQGQVRVAAAQLEQARANTLSPAAQADRAARDYRRYLDVHARTPAAVAAQQLDQARAAAADQSAQLLAARKQVKTAQAQLASARTQISAAEAQVKTAEADIAQARLQIAYARVVALRAGHVAHKTVAVGDFAQTGQELLSVVPDQLWVTANFKETQLRHVRLGQRVEIKVDAYKDVAFEGHVDSIQRGAGQAFSALPAQNASGNFVKVVQRVPVKIAIDRAPADRPLGPGMSVIPRVRID